VRNEAWKLVPSASLKHTFQLSSDRETQPAGGMLLLDGDLVLSSSGGTGAGAGAASRTVRRLFTLTSSWVLAPVSDSTTSFFFSAERQREGARGGALGEPRDPPRGRPAEGRTGEADLGRAGGGAEARLRVPAGVRHGGSGARRGAWSCLVAAWSNRVGEFRSPPAFG
jgi:hypothetical protein